MSLEQRIESLEAAIVKLTVAFSSVSVGSASDAGSKTTGKDAKTTSKTTAKTTTKVESKYTLEQLKALLQDYKAAFGIAEAKKLLPGMGYENSNAVPADKVDEVYDSVQELINAKASAEEDNGDL